MSQETYAVDLPGKILYDKEFEVDIRKITPIEQKYIISLGQKQQRSNKDYLEFIRKLIVFNREDVKLEDLFWFDVQYLLYRIRFTTYTKYPIKLKFKCLGTREDGSVCTQEITKELDMGNLVINTPDDNPNRTDTITLDNLGETKIRNKILGDDIEIDKMLKKLNIDEDDAQMRLLMLDLCLISNGKSLEEMYKLAENGTITAEDIVGIEKWFVDNVWGVKEELTIKCPICGKEESRAYALHLEDFFSAI